MSKELCFNPSARNIKVIIPAAGIGKRLLPHTYTIPKPLISLAGKPIISHILDSLGSINIDSLGLILNDRGEQILDFIKSNYKFKLTYVYQHNQNGLGHALYLYFKKYRPDNNPVLIILCDTIFNADLRTVIENDYTTICVHKVADTSCYGIAETNGAFIERLVEKPKFSSSNLAVIGVYFIRNVPLLYDCLDYIIKNNIKTKNEYQLTDALQLLLERGESMIALEVPEWYDCGTSDMLLNTNKMLLNKVHNHLNIPNSIIIEPVIISELAIINNSIIGPYVAIADGAVITRSIIENSIIDRNVSISNAIIADSIIDSNTVYEGCLSKLNVAGFSQVIFKEGERKW